MQQQKIRYIQALLPIMGIFMHKTSQMQLGLMRLYGYNFKFFIKNNLIIFLTTEIVAIYACDATYLSYYFLPAASMPGE